MNSHKFSIYDTVIIGVMAALCFVSTAFLKIGPIPTPAGPTMIKVTPKTLVPSVKMMSSPT